MGWRGLKEESLYSWTGVRGRNGHGEAVLGAAEKVNQRCLRMKG